MNHLILAGALTSCLGFFLTYDAGVAFTLSGAAIAAAAAAINAETSVRLYLLIRSRKQ